MNSIAAATLYLAYLGGVGALVLLAWNSTRNFFINSFAVSISILVLSQVVLRILGTSVALWYWVVHLTAFSLVISGLVTRNKRLRFSVCEWGRLDFHAAWPVCLIALSLTAYHLWVGPYTEIPSDYWARLSDVAEQRMLVDRGMFPAGIQFVDLFEDKLYVPFLHAMVSSQLGILPIWLTSPATLVSTCFFLLATYFFAMQVGIQEGWTKSQRRITALLAALLTSLVVGVSSFSYIRYYAYFPHIVNATLLYATLLHFFDFLDREEASTTRLLFTAIFLTTMAFINKQEALMACILIVGLTFWRFGRHSICHFPSSLLLMRRSRKTAAVVVLLTCFLIVFTFVSREPGSWMAPHLIDLGDFWEPLRGLLVANPAMRVVDALGIFGLITYIWFFCEIRRFHNRDYILIGMLVPLLTLFNPLFVYWFLHVASWDPLWRFAFISPIALVAANLIVLATRRPNMGVNSLQVGFRRVMVLALFISVTPFAVGDFSNRFSRIPSLMAIDETAGSGLYEDLIAFLDKQDAGTRIITDYVTNYLLTSAVSVEGRRDAKGSWQLKRSDLDGDFKNTLLYYQNDDSLVVVNKRNGGLSWTGKTSGHWPEDILQVHAFYPEGFQQFLDERTADFKKVWEQNSISIYRVLRNPEDY